MGTPQWAIKKMLTPEDREAKLPVWAQELIRGLRIYATEQRDLARQVVEGTNPHETNTMVVDYETHEGYYGMPRDAVIRLIPTDSGYLEVQVRGKYVHVRGSDSLEVLPVVSNVVAVRALTPAERRDAL